MRIILSQKKKIESTKIDFLIRDSNLRRPKRQRKQNYETLPTAQNLRCVMYCVVKIIINYIKH